MGILNLIKGLIPRHYLYEALPWRVFLDDNLVCLRHKGILQGWTLTGPSPDIHGLPEMGRRVELYGRALGQLGAGDEIQIVFDRLPAPASPKRVFEHAAAQLVHDEMRDEAQHWITPSRLYLSHQYAPPATHAAHQIMLGDIPQPTEKKNHHLMRDLALQRFAAFRDACNDAFKLRAMSKAEMFRDLLYRVSYITAPISLPDDGVDLAKVIGSSGRQYNGYYPSINGWYLRPIIIPTYPTDTLPQMLSSLLEYQGYLTVSCRYMALNQVAAQGSMKAQQDHWLVEQMGGIQGFIRALLKSNKANRHAMEQVELIEHAIKTSQNGWPFGHTAITVIVRDRDPEQADVRVHDLLSTLHGQGIMARLEDTGAAQIVENSWPGHLILEKKDYVACRHKVLLTGYNFADLSLPATYWQGSEDSPLTCSGTASIPFGLPLSVNGLGHMLWVGPSGTGKSTLLSTLACSLLSIPDSKIAWLDLDHSSFVLSHLLGAAYHDLGTQGTPPLCPLAALDREGGLEWLAGWFERLFQRRKGFELDERQMEDFMLALRTARRMGIRDLLTFRTAIEQGEEGRNRIRRILKEIIDYYGHVLGGSSETTTENRVTVYEMRGLMGLPRYIAAPAIELLLHEIVSKLDGTPSWVLADEFWSLLGDEISAGWLFDTLRTLRKKNASFIGCTQSLDEIVNSPFRGLLLESCPAKIFLPNHAAGSLYGGEQYIKLGVSPHEISRIACGSVGDFYYTSPHGARAATCYLGPVGQAICAATGHKDYQRARELIAQYGVDGFREAWLRQSGIHLPDQGQALAGGGAGVEPDQHDADWVSGGNGGLPVQLAAAG